MGRKIPRFYIQGEEYWVTTPDPTPEDEIEEFLGGLFGMPPKDLVNELIDRLGEAHIAYVLGWDDDIESGLIKYFEKRGEDVEDGVGNIFNGTPVEIIDRIVDILGAKPVCEAIKYHEGSIDLLLEEWQNE